VRCICRHPNPDIAPLEQVESVTATVMDLTAGVFYVAPGIPCQVPFTPIAV
jgi:isopenicillin-N N-acyltransferase-like protein